MTTILSTNALSKHYFHRDGLIMALDDVSISVSEGSFVTITGPSGSGKTTLLMALSGLIRPTSGKIYFKEQMLETDNDTALVEFRKRYTGFIMQNFSLIPYMTAIQNVMLPLSLNSISEESRKHRAVELLELAGLGNRMNHYPRELSAGQQQRVAIARALANKPAIIFADEPTGNLDPMLSVEILNFLKEINEKNRITIFMVTHSPAAGAYGNVSIKLRDGRIEN
ncbi:MAG TPA: ABC transporter ATP-binding protein [Bacteroidales bacterium]|nr:ABC transporter ATP-binding protein [Bacteroidales bacterium]HPM92520.1 ABC transporter ATP-binding protein [Bacteroidales bacterium]